jgi:hypothetical protein
MAIRAEGQHLDRDVAELTQLDHVPDLPAHGLGAPDRAPQHRFVDDRPQAGRIGLVQQLLAAHPQH